MSISSIGTSPLAQLYSSSKSAATKSTVTSSNAASNSEPAGSRVTLSADAQAIAGLNADGVTVTQVPIGGYELSSGKLLPPTPTNGTVSETVFETIAEEFGATKSQADQDFQAIDTNDSGSISNSEFLTAMGDTRDSSGASSQALVSLMDANGDGTVSGSEFVNFETAVVGAEKSSG
jgi:hypothetical protein